MSRPEDASTRPWKRADGGFVLAVRLTPRSAVDALDGTETLSDGRPVFKARVRALPSDGEANAALVALLAGIFSVPKSAVTLKSGASARIKMMLISGDAPALEARLLTHLAIAATRTSRRI
jgi:uncharacterized protein YggU (UPF0235/DUF167 family)